MNKHSPLPWTVRPHLSDAHFEVVADANDNTVGTATRREDAALTVEAVNERDRLRDIVRRLCDELESHYHEPESMDDPCIIREAREALGESIKEGGAE